MKYKRILLKLSGESLMGSQNHGIDPVRLDSFTEQIKEIHDIGVEVGIVIGGGNIFRGMQGISSGVDRINGDYMGMLATVINGLGLQSGLRQKGVPARVFTAIRMEPAADYYNRLACIKSLEKGEIAIFTAGTSNPFFTTDSAAALRGVEMNVDVLLKGTRVDGIYTADPEKDSNAKKYDSITFTQAYEQGLSIMDLTAFTLCKENNLNIVVFDMNTPGNLKKLILGEKIGTLVHN